MNLYLTRLGNRNIEAVCKELNILTGECYGYPATEPRWLGTGRMDWEGPHDSNQSPPAPDFNGVLLCDWEYHDSEGNPRMAGRELDACRLAVKGAYPKAKHTFYLHCENTDKLDWTKLRAANRLQDDLRQWWGVSPVLYQWTKREPHTYMIDVQMSYARICAKGANIVPVISPRSFYEAPLNGPCSLEVEQAHLEYLVANYHDLDGLFIFDRNSYESYRPMTPEREAHTVAYLRMVRKVVQ